MAVVVIFAAIIIITITIKANSLAETIEGLDTCCFLTLPEWFILKRSHASEAL